MINCFRIDVIESSFWWGRWQNDYDDDRYTLSIPLIGLPTVITIIIIIIVISRVAILWSAHCNGVVQDQLLPNSANSTGTRCCGPTGFRPEPRTILTFENPKKTPFTLFVIWLHWNFAPFWSCKRNHVTDTSYYNATIITIMRQLLTLNTFYSIVSAKVGSIHGRS